MSNVIVKIGDGLSLKKKLVIGFILLAALPVIFTAIITTYLSNNALVSAVYENNQRMAVVLADNFNGMIDAKIKVLKVTANSPELQSMEIGKQLPVLWSMTKQYPEMQLIITDNQGTQTLRTEGALASSADRDYFKQVKTGASYAISDVLVAKGTGKASVIIAVPIKEPLGRFMGTLLGVVDLQYLSLVVDEIKIGQTGYVALFDRQGRVIAHPNKTLVQEMTDLSSVAPVREAISGKTGAVSYEYQGDKKLAGYSTIALSGWGIVAQQPYDEALAGANKVRLTGVASTLVAVLIAVIVGFLAAGVLTRPVQELVVAARRIAEGDLTAKAAVTSKDELGQMAQTFNTMVDNLQNLIRGIIGTAELVVASSQELSATSGDAERAVNQIAVTMTEFAQGAHHQTDEMDKTLRVVDNLTAVSQSVAEKAKSASNLSADMALAAETGGGAVRNAMDKMNEIKEVTAATSVVVGALGEKSKQIGQILDVISGIAGQTNLLALNAAIEAARAGEQGRGFAVVAEEVRKLAEQSQVATQQIAQIVQEIKQQTEEAILAMASGSSKVNEGVDVVRTAGQELENILGQIATSVSMIGDIDSASNQQLLGMREMVSSAADVATIARQSSAGAQSTAAASEQMTASMGEIASAADALDKLAGELQTMVAKFKI